MNKFKSLSKKLKKNHHKKNLDVTKEVGTIYDFTIIEKLKEEKKVTPSGLKEKTVNIEPKNEVDNFNNLDEKNKSFFKNWIVYDNPNQSRFAKFFKELEEEKKQKNETNTNIKENEDKKENEEEDETNNIYDNISSNPSEDNSREPKESKETKDDDNFNISSILANFEIFENDFENNQEEKAAKEKKDEELNLDLKIYLINLIKNIF